MISPVCVSAIFSMSEPTTIQDAMAPDTIDLSVPDVIDLTVDVIDLTVQDGRVDLTAEDDADTIGENGDVIDLTAEDAMDEDWTSDMTEARLNEFLENHDVEVIVAVFGVGMMQILTNPDHLQTLIERGVDFFFDYIQEDTFTL